MENETTELQDYINATIKAIKGAVEGTNFDITTPVSFDLAVTNTSEGAGGFKVYVAKAEGKLKSEEISRIKFDITPKTKLELQRQINRERRLGGLDSTK